jgi:hypothetical protein
MLAWLRETMEPARVGEAEIAALVEATTGIPVARRAEEPSAEETRTTFLM